MEKTATQMSRTAPQTFENSLGQLFEATADLFKAEFKASLREGMRKNGKKRIFLMMCAPIVGLWALLALYQLCLRLCVLSVLSVAPDLTLLTQHLLGQCIMFLLCVAALACIFGLLMRGQATST